MDNNLLRILVLSSLLVSVLSQVFVKEIVVTNQSESNLTTEKSSKIDPRIELIPETTETNDYFPPDDDNCPLDDVSVYMTGCWVDSFNVWQLNITEITPNGMIRSSCQASQECGLKFCCAANQALNCFSTFGRYFCTNEFSRMGIQFAQTLNRMCGNSSSDDKCRSIVSLSESKMKRVITDSDISDAFADEKEPIVQVIKEPELQKITIQLRFNGSVGVVASVATISALLLVTAFFV